MQFEELTKKTYSSHKFYFLRSLYMRNAYHLVKDGGSHHAGFPKEEEKIVLYEENQEFQNKLFKNFLIVEWVSGRP